MRESGAGVKGGAIREKAEVRREWVRTMSRWRKARTARLYSGRRVVAVSWCGGAGGDDLSAAGSVVSLKGI